MAETSGLPDPDLDEPGEPIHASLELEDGTRKPYDISQTKRDTASRSQRGRVGNST